MRQKVVLFFIFFSFSVIFSLAQEEQIVFNSLADFKENERILILAPHPDDEAIACAGVIQKALKQGAKVKIVYLTMGENNEIAFIVYKKRPVLSKKEFIALGKIRQKEAVKAMEVLGLKKEDLIFLGYPDFGTLSIFMRYWKSIRPYRSLLTRISSVPYFEAISFGAPYLAESILNDLKKVLLDYQPQGIFVSHPLDTNVDHKAFYLFLQIALAELKEKIPSPEVYPYLVHHVGWPLPRHYHPQLLLIPPQEFCEQFFNWLKLDLTEEEIENKKKAILCYKSQTMSSAFYLLSFARKNELFGGALEINLSAKPQEKKEFSWGLF